MQKLTCLSERSQKQEDATKKRANPDDVSDNEFLEQANVIKAKHFSVENTKETNSSWVNREKRLSQIREENIRSLTDLTI